MASLAKFNTRVQLKFDALANWNTNSTFIPLRGEVCIVQVPTGSAVEQVTPPAYLMKVGDGSSTFSQLPWLSALAADVHTWAKKSAADFTTWATDNGENYADSPKLATKAELAELASRVAALETTVKNLSGAMRFIGFATDEVKITDGGNEVPVINGWPTVDENNNPVPAYAPTAGDVVISDGLEYVFTTTGVWELFGQDGDYAIKGSITNSDIAAAAAIAPTKIAPIFENNKNLAEDLADLGEGLRQVNSNMVGMWKSTTLNIVENSAGLAAAQHSNIQIGDKAMDYIVFDCGTSSLNI